MSCHIQELRTERICAGIMSGPRLCFITLMFQMCGCFVVFFGSGQRKRSCDYMLAWWQRRMRRSVSSPTSTVLLELADCTARLSSLLGDQHCLRHDVPHSCSFSTLHSA